MRRDLSASVCRPAAAWLLAVSACLFLAGNLRAWGGSPLTWLDGTQPWETTPMNEVDLQALGEGGDGQGRAGLGAQWGVLDELQAAGQWSRSTQGSASSGELDLRLREPDFPDARPAFSVYARVPDVEGSWQAWAGLAADWEPWDTSLALNAETGDDGRWRLRLAAWTPYVAPTLRLGIEAAWLDAAAEALTPQLVFNLPGDLSLQAGLRLGTGVGDDLWTLRLSYELFQNP